MADPTTDLLEIILRECAGARPQPWYPADYARDTGVARAALDEPLDRLRLAGLVRLTDWVQGKGQGYTLTPAGEQVLERPRLLDRLRQGVVPRAPAPPPDRAREEQAPGMERARAVRDALLDRARPVMTFSLILANVLVFAVGAALAQRQDALSAYLSTGLLGGGPRNQAEQQAEARANEVRHALGLLEKPDVVARGEWWRLLTCCFVHIGFIHLAMNMYALYVLGGLLERMWGPTRYLLLYLIAGVVGSCAAMVYSPAGGLAGASGAICGMLGALAAWVYLNRPYLPRDLSASLMRAVVTNVILIVFISLIPGVSASAHFGGGAAGLVAAVPMTYSRFGHGLPRWLGLVGALAVPVVAVAWVAHSFAADKVARAQTTLERAQSLGWEVYKKDVKPLCEKVESGKAVGADEVTRALGEAARARQEIQQLGRSLPEPGSSDDGAINAGLQFGQDYVNAWVHLFEQFQQTFADGRKATPEEARAVRGLIGPVNRTTEHLNDSALFKSRKK